MKKILQFPYMIGAFIIILMASSLLLVNAEEVDVNPIQFAINDGLLQYKSLDNEWITLTDMDQLEGTPGRGVEDISIGENGHLYVSLSDQTLIDLGSIIGAQGPNGEPGISIDTAQISSTGELVIVYSDGSESNLGSIVGNDGQDGEVGRGIKTVSISDKGELLITLTDDQVLNPGSVIGPRGTTGPQGPRGLQGTPGADGSDGANGLTPSIGENGNWYIGSTDTGTFAGDVIIELRTIEDLQDIENCMTCDYKLMDDIDLRAHDWTPLGSSSNPFSGTLDGNGFKINDVSSTNPIDDFGFFKVIQAPATIKNLEIEMDEAFNMGLNSGLLASKIEGDNSFEESVYLSNLIFGVNHDIAVGDNFGFVSGLVDSIDSLEISNVSIYDDSSSNITFERNAGGMIGSIIYSTVNIVNSSVDLNGNFTSSEANIGGYIGNAVNSDVILKNSTLDIDFTGSATEIGGIAGSFVDSALELKDFTVYGSINATGSSNVGFVVGYLGSYSILNVNNSTFGDYNNNIDIRGNIENVGLIVGQAYNAEEIIIMNSTLRGNIRDNNETRSNSSRNAGGIAGSLVSEKSVNSTSDIFISNIQIELDINNYNDNIGGLVGLNYGFDSVINDVYAEMEFGTSGIVIDNVGGFYGQITFESQDISGNAIYHETNTHILNSHTYLEDVRVSNSAVGGFVGQFKSVELITNSFLDFDPSINNGRESDIFIENSKVTGYFYADNGKSGGFIGEMIGGDAELIDSSINAEVGTSSADYTALGIGYAESAQIEFLRNSFKGDIGGNDYIGGFVGFANNFGHLRIEYNDLLLFSYDSTSNNGNYISNPNDINFNEQNNHIIKGIE